MKELYLKRLLQKPVKSRSLAGRSSKDNGRLSNAWGEGFCYTAVFFLMAEISLLVSCITLLIFNTSSLILNTLFFFLLNSSTSLVFHSLFFLSRRLPEGTLRQILVPFFVRNS